MDSSLQINEALQLPREGFIHYQSRALFYNIIALVINLEVLLSSLGVGRLGVEGLSKREKGLMDMDNSVVIAASRGI